MVQPTHAGCDSATNSYVESTLMALFRLSSINDLILSFSEEDRTNVLLSNLKGLFLSWKKEPNRNVSSEAVEHVLRQLGLYERISSEPQESLFSTITELVCSHLASLLPAESTEPNFIYAKIDSAHGHSSEGVVPQLHWQYITAFPPASQADAFALENGLPLELSSSKTDHSYRLRAVLCTASSSLGYFPYGNAWYPLSDSLFGLSTKPVHREEIVQLLSTFGGLLFFELQTHVQKQAQATLRRLEQDLRPSPKSPLRESPSNSKSHFSFSGKNYSIDSLPSGNVKLVNDREYPPNEFLSVPSCPRKLGTKTHRQKGLASARSSSDRSLESSLRLGLSFDSIKAKHQRAKSQSVTDSSSICVNECSTSSCGSFSSKDEGHDLGLDLDGPEGPSPSALSRRKHILPMQEHKQMYEQASFEGSCTPSYGRSSSYDQMPSSQHK